MTSSQKLLRMVQIDKRFPGVHALKGVDFDLEAGEVHVLLGENGAGKSTLMKVLSGSVQRDGGQIFIQGEEVKNLTPERTQRLGIGMVYQELSLVPALTVAENVFLGQLPRTALGLVDWPHIHERTRAIFELMGVNIDPRQEVRQLSVAQQQLTEIARVLAREARIILLDEPTSALSDTERDHLFEIIRRLQSQGVGIIYISHRLSELKEIGQRVTVMRDGQVVRTMPIEEADPDLLANLMVGRDLTEQFPKTIGEPGEIALRVEGLALEGTLEDVSFELRQGEILGIFGLMGAGQTELAQVLFGLREATAGRVLIGDKAVRLTQPVQAIAHGVGFLPRDRRASLLPMQAIPANITLANVSQFPILKFLNLRQEVRTAEDYVRDLSIRPPLLDRPVSYLSGGNQQKVCLARWLCNEAKILIVDEPTRGIDVGAKAEVFELIDRLTRTGVSVIMISSEMPEILAMADRILVMRSGRISAQYERGQATQELLLRSAS